MSDLGERFLQLIKLKQTLSEVCFHHSLIIIGVSFNLTSIRIQAVHVNTSMLTPWLNLETQSWTRAWRDLVTTSLPG